MATNMKLTNKLAKLPNEIEICGCTDHLHSYELSILWKTSDTTLCPYCGSKDFVRKGRSDTKTVYHVHVGGYALLLTFSLQRFVCRNPDCRKNFTESPSWLHPDLKMTQLLLLNICAALQTTSSIRQIAADHYVTERIVTNALQSVHFGNHQMLPSALIAGARISSERGDQILKPALRRLLLILRHLLLFEQLLTENSVFYCPSLILRHFLLLILRHFLLILRHFLLIYTQSDDPDATALYLC